MFNVFVLTVIHLTKFQNVLKHSKALNKRFIVSILILKELLCYPNDSKWWIM